MNVCVAQPKRNLPQTIYLIASNEQGKMARIEVKYQPFFYIQKSSNCKLTDDQFDKVISDQCTISGCTYTVDQKKTILHYQKDTKRTYHIRTPNTKIKNDLVNRLRNNVLCTTTYEPAFCDFFESEISTGDKFMIETGLNVGAWIDITNATRIDCLGHYDYFYQAEAASLKILTDEKYQFRVSPFNAVYYDIECSVKNDLPPVPSFTNEMLQKKGLDTSEAANMETDEIVSISAIIKTYFTLEPNIRKFSFVARKSWWKGTIDNPNIVLCDGERGIIENFYNTCKQHKCLVYIGWNSDNFDIQFLQDRMKELGMNMNFSLFNEKTNFESRFWVIAKGFLKAKKQDNSMDDVINLDLERMWMSNYKEPSYKLNSVAEKHLELNKIDIDYRQITKFGLKGDEKECTLLAKYNLNDCLLTMNLMDKDNLMMLTFFMARLDKIVPEAVLYTGQQNYLTNLLLWYIKYLKEYYILPNRKRVIVDESEEINFPGALVIDPFMRGYIEDPMAVNDFESLYPSIMIAFSTCLTTHIENPDTCGIPKSDLLRVVAADNPLLTKKKVKEQEKLNKKRKMASKKPRSKKKHKCDYDPWKQTTINFKHTTKSDGKIVSTPIIGVPESNANEIIDKIKPNNFKYDPKNLPKVDWGISELTPDGDLVIVNYYYTHDRSIFPKLSAYLKKVRKDLKNNIKNELEKKFNKLKTFFDKLGMKPASSKPELADYLKMIKENPQLKNEHKTFFVEVAEIDTKISLFDIAQLCVKNNGNSLYGYVSSSKSRIPCPGNGATICALGRMILGFEAEIFNKSIDLKIYPEKKEWKLRILNDEELGGDILDTFEKYHKNGGGTIEDVRRKKPPKTNFVSSVKVLSGDTDSTMPIFMKERIVEGKLGDTDITQAIQYANYAITREIERRFTRQKDVLKIANENYAFNWIEVQMKNYIADVKPPTISKPEDVKFEPVSSANAKRLAKGVPIVRRDTNATAARLYKFFVDQIFTHRNGIVAYENSLKMLQETVLDLRFWRMKLSDYILTTKLMKEAADYKSPPGHATAVLKMIERGSKYPIPEKGDRVVYLFAISDREHDKISDHAMDVRMFLDDLRAGEKIKLHIGHYLNDTIINKIQLLTDPLSSNVNCPMKNVNRRIDEIANKTYKQTKLSPEEAGKTLEWHRTELKKYIDKCKACIKKETSQITDIEDCQSSITCKNWIDKQFSTTIIQLLTRTGELNDRAVFMK